jgi:hypothetical protein
MGVSKDGGEPLRQCFYRLNYGASPRFVDSGGGG